MNLYAQTSAVSPAGNPLGGFVPLILIFVVFYFLLIRPQQKKEKEMKKMLAALKRGDYVLTSGGVYGTITNIKPDIVEVKVDENTRLQMARASIVQVVTKSPEETQAAPAQIIS